jgi:glutamate--cysteine ligase catalytic subunit
MIKEVHRAEQEVDHHDRYEGCTWQPEFGAWMIESTPIRPYTGYANDLLR